MSDLLQADFKSIIEKILTGTPQDWKLSRNFFRDFYEKNIQKDHNDWNKQNVEKVFLALKQFTKPSGAHFTESFLKELSGDSLSINIIKRLMDIVKVCDVNAYQQDQALPVVAKTGIRQDVYYKNILQWKLEKRRDDPIEDIIKSKQLNLSFKNIFLFLYEPKKYLSISSPWHRKKFIKIFIDNDYTLTSKDNYQKACIESNKLIMDYFKNYLQSAPELLRRLETASLNEHFLSRVITMAVYHEDCNPLWNPKKKKSDQDKFNYWQIAPGRGARLWDELRDQSIAAVGYSKLDLDLAGKSEEEVLGLFKENYPEYPERKTQIQFRKLWNFLNLKPNDKIITNKGRSLLLGLGIVKGRYKFIANRKEYKHTIDVDYYIISEKGIPIPETFKGKFGTTITPLNKKVFETLEALFPLDGEPSIWWVNQGATLSAEKEDGFLWAPLKTKSGQSIYHWDTMEEVKKDDIILHYANGSLRYVSQVFKPHEIAKKPESLKSEQWEEEGRLVHVEYHELIPTIPLVKFNQKLLKLNIEQGPIDSNGRVKQGYLFRFSEEALSIIQDAQNETSWPEFAKIHDVPLEHNFWIFQANPKIYDLEGSLKSLNKQKWSVRQYKNEIKIGDTVYLWQSGPNAGILAKSTVLTKPALISEK